MGRKKKNRIVNYLLLFFLCVFLVNAVTDSNMILSFFISITTLLLTMFLLFIITVIHEIGHFVFGLLFGYKFVALVFAFFKFYVENDKLKFKFTKPKQFMGYSSMLPQDESIVKYKWYIAGGILFNLLSGVIFYILYINSPTENYFLRYLTMSSMLMALLNAFPIKRNSMPASDGAKLWTLSFGKEDKPHFLKMLKFMEVSAAGVRPRELEDLIDENNIKFPEQYITLYSVALDMHDIETMKLCSQKLEENFDKTNELSFIGYTYAIMHTACITGDIEKAHEYYNKCRKHVEKDNDCNGFRIRAYYEYYANNNPEYALELCNQGLVVVDKFVSKGHATMEKDLLAKLQNQIINEAT